MNEQQTDLTWDELVEELTGLGWRKPQCVPLEAIWTDFADRHISIENLSKGMGVLIEERVDPDTDEEIFIPTTSLRHARAIALAITQGDK